MTDKLTPTQTLLMWGLLAQQGIAKQADIVPKVAPKDRKALETAKFVSVTKRSRSLWLKLEDKGWSYATDHMRDPLPPAQGTLHGMMMRLHEHLEKTDEVLADFIGQAAEPANDPKSHTKLKPNRKSPKPKPPREPESVRQAIERAYLAVTGGRKGIEARLSAIRPHLVHLDRATVDAALAQIRRGDAKARLMRIDDQRSITPEDSKAALPFAGENLHILWIGR